MRKFFLFFSFFLFYAYNIFSQASLPALPPDNESGQKPDSAKKYKDLFVSDNFYDFYNLTNKTIGYSTLGYGRQYGKFIALAKAGIGNSFVESKHQDKDYLIDLESYVFFNKKYYCWVNYIRSSGNIFPLNKVCAQIYRNLPEGWVVSTGIRYFNFKSNNNLIAYTFGVEKYINVYWLNFNAYLYKDNYDEFVQSYNFELRRFFQDEKSFVSVKFGWGNINNRELQTSDFLNQRTDKGFVMINYKKFVTQKFYFNTDIHYSFNESNSIIYGASLYLGLIL